jgi:hypothetical protein
MDHSINYISIADYNSTENNIVYSVWNNMYDLEHCITSEYINDDYITVIQYDNIMRFLDEIS